jgi:PAS domain S-box-containing protein
MKKDSPQDLYFLSDGGEMGELTRNFNWADSSLGHPSTWPQSLRLTVSMILKSKFPMFLFWGEDHIQFYNDAYRPSLGNNGKHPSALGQKGFDCWPEIWADIFPLIQKARNEGVASYSEDQLLPIYRNGKMEDVYWTFSYSPIMGDDGTVGGVHVVCTETTAKVLAVKKLENSGNELTESEQKIRSLVESAPFPIGVYIGKEMKVDLANQSIMDIWGKGNDVIGKRFSEILPELDNQEVFKQLDNVYESGVAFHIKNQHLDLIVDGKVKPYYFNYSLTPLFDSLGKVYGVMNTGADVTELNMAKLKIQESESKLRSTILQSPVAMCILIGPTFIVELANDMMFELWGKTASEVMNKPLFEGVFEAKDQGFEDMIGGVYNTGVTFSADGVPTPLNRNGKPELSYVNVLYQPYRDEHNVIIGVLAVATDVTAQAIATKQIQEAEEKARLAINSAELGVYEVFYASGEMITDKRFKDIWGVNQYVAREKYAAAIHPDDLANRERAHEQSITTGQLQYQTRVIWKDQSIRWVSITGKVIYDDKGQPFKLIGIIQDITSMVLSQKKIEESEKNIKDMILQAPVAMCIFKGPDHIVEIANKTMFELWGKAEDQVMGKPIFEGLPEAKEQGLEKLLGDVYHNGQRFVANEMPVNLPRGEKIETRYVNFVYEPMQRGTKEESGVLAVALDVTTQVMARQKIEEIVTERTLELGRANEKLHKSNAELEQFAYIASHDLQEPVRKISTFTQLLEKSLGPVSEKSKGYLDKVNASAKRMTALIRDVLQYSQLSEINEQFDRVNLNQVIEDIKIEFELTIEEKKAIINYSGLPIIEAIPLQMSQLFSNLLSNALKYSKSGSKPEIEIKADLLTKEEVAEHVTLNQNKSYYKIYFSDNGIGIKAEQTGRVFNIFQRLHAKTEYAGTGIGLSICKKIVQNHHGEISVISDEGKGATFIIILPKHFRIRID